MTVNIYNVLFAFDSKFVPQRLYMCVALISRELPSSMLVARSRPQSLQAVQPKVQCNATGTLMLQVCFSGGLQAGARQQANSSQLLLCSRHERYSTFQGESEFFASFLVSSGATAAAPRAAPSQDRGAQLPVGPAELEPQCHLMLSVFLSITYWTSGESNSTVLFYKCQWRLFWNRSKDC